ncbi:F-box domain-containing protein [Colletotrichum sojae]|uniref:F-box domain-containing protein n=1 Tax=Colletotrichum sojae TaxID=2175907 RepID=A0A8H6IYT9_9PEZI|nr:F-box domain-containing protein [Colletotrichum sojae]
MTMAPRHARAGRGNRSARRRYDPSVPSSSAKIQLINLPRELLFEIFHHCKPKNEERGNYYWWFNHETPALFKLSRVNKYIRALSVPILFKHMRGSMKEEMLQSRLQEIEGNESILSAVRCLTVSVNGHGKPRELWEAQTPRKPCDASTPGLFAHVLSKMSNLQELFIEIEYADKSLEAPFRTELLSKGITFPSVRDLKYHISLNVSFVPDVFANLQVLHVCIQVSPKKTKGLATIASRLTLHTVDLFKAAKWREQDVEEIVDLFPSVVTLLVRGGLKATRPAKLIPIFQKFNSLVDLTLVTMTRMPSIPYLVSQGWLNGEDPKSMAMTFFQTCPRLARLQFNTDVPIDVFVPKRQGDEVIGLLDETGKQVP